MGSAQPLAIQPQQSAGFQLEVAEVIAETHDSRSLVLRIPAGLEERFRYKPGQFLSFRVVVGGKRLTRCYSMSSSPDCDALPKVTIKRVEGGRVSNWFNEQVRAGDLLDVLPPAGHFHLLPGERDLVLFGGGSGITPVFSILKSALKTSRRRIKLVYANRDEASVIFRDELRVLAKAHVDQLEVVHVLDSVQGFLSEGEVRQLVRGHAGAEFYICGPGPFMDTVERALRGAGEDAARIHVERFASPPDPDEGGGPGRGGASRSRRTGGRPGWRGPQAGLAAGRKPVAEHAPGRPGCPLFLRGGLLRCLHVSGGGGRGRAPAQRYPQPCGAGRRLDPGVPGSAGRRAAETEVPGVTAGDASPSGAASSV